MLDWISYLFGSAKRYNQSDTVKGKEHLTD